MIGLNLATKTICMKTGHTVVSSLFWQAAEEEAEEPNEDEDEGEEQEEEDQDDENEDEDEDAGEEQEGRRPGR